jgi:hypothetical protein
MKSDVCKIENGTKDLALILKECDKVASYNQFNNKQALQLRLLCEELDGMLPNLVDDFTGDFWIEYDHGVCKVNASIKIPDFNTDKKEELIAVSKSKKNASAVGIVGKIRNLLEDLFLADGDYSYIPTSSLLSMASGYCEGVDCSYMWTLNQYKTTIVEEQKEDWDELEKSIIANLADDVIVGVKGKKANIVIVKKF